MLDLNVMDLVCVDSTCDDNEVRLTMEKLPEDDNVTSSSSSVVNADVGDEHSSSTHTNIHTFNKGLQKCNENLVPELITRQLFPLGVGESDEFSSSSRWLNLMVPQLIEQQPQKQVKKSRRGPRSRSSPYRGVTFYRRTGRWESHIWDSGKQVYLGGFDTAQAAARAYDRAAIKFRGLDADINFNISDYDEDLKEMNNLTKEEFVQSLRRQTTGFSRGSSKYRGVTLHKCGRWEARMGQFLGKKAYDKAAIKCNGLEAFTNFEPSTYEEELGLVAKDGDSGHNLDLNLWISPPPDGPKGNQNARNLRFHSATYQLPNGKRPKLESSASPMGGQTPYGLTMATMNLPIWPAKYPGFTPDYEERAMGKREAEAVSSQGLSKWAWQLQDHHSMVTSDPLFSSTTTVAASSGFSSTIPPFSNYSHLPLNKTPHNQKN